MHDDLLGRKFTATAVNRLWLTDITEHPTGEGKLYMCAVKDVYSGRIVGYSIDARMIASPAVSALRNAVALRDPVATIVHSDRDSQFRSHAFVRTLCSNDLRDSIAIVTKVERTHHRQRRQRDLDRLTPIEYETLTTAARAA